MPEKTIADALQALEAADRELDRWPPQSAEEARLTGAMVELHQVVSMLSDAAHQNADAVKRGREAVERARVTIAELERQAAGDTAVSGLE